MPSETDEELEVLFTELGSCNTEMGHALYYKHYDSDDRARWIVSLLRRTKIAAAQAEALLLKRLEARRRRDLGDLAPG
jgi:hypothetical protein